MDLITVELQSGQTIALSGVAGDFSGDGPVQMGREGRSRHLGETFEAMLPPLEQAARSLAEGLKSAAPDEIELAMGVMITAQAGAVIAKAGAESHFTVKLTWKKGPEKAEKE